MEISGTNVLNGPGFSKSTQSSNEACKMQKRASEGHLGVVLSQGRSRLWTRLKRGDRDKRRVLQQRLGDAGDWPHWRADSPANKERQVLAHHRHRKTSGKSTMHIASSKKRD
jgi:hypothetical protein